jgi:hypothetical protein
MAADAKPVDSGTLTWYIRWLSERYPDWTDEQRLEIATGFVTAQLPPERPVEDDDPVEAMERLTDQEIRAADRKARRYLTGKELMEILQTPGAIPKVS